MTGLATAFFLAFIAILVIFAAGGVHLTSSGETRQAGIVEAQDLPWPSGEGPDAILPDPATDPTRGLSWLMVIDAPEFTVAVVTNIRDLWWAREGSTLTEGLTVKEIATDPPGVTIAAADGSRHALSYWCGDFHTLPAPGPGEKP